ncbi:MAG: class I SAM-dependent methyltransferase [Bacteroidetes bacterium]|nr:class I SAM-dependent methyltransferase [Bacteroidota bacterium]
MAEKTCPVWVGYLLASPVRKLFNNPKKILGEYIKEGMTVLDLGSAMGFFSIPAARMVGPNGKVICIDVQEKMIEKLKKRALKAGMLDRIETIVCDENSLKLTDYSNKIDFAYAFAVIHEVPNVDSFFSDAYKALKSNTKFFIAEPKGHVTKEDFDKTISIAEKNGFEVVNKSKIGRNLSVLLKKA